MKSGGLAWPKKAPKSILLLKSHSAGIGDLLRSSAAWRVLHNSFPGTQLHLWFLTQEPGAPIEELMARHHLLASFQISDKRTRGYSGWKVLLAKGWQIAREMRPQLIIDCEPNGLRTALLSRFVAQCARAKTVGIAQVPGRGLFYNRVAPSFKTYARRHGVSLPLNYADRDFVALAALGLERENTAIELRETEHGRVFRERLCAELGEKRAPLLGLNIGCGTGTAYGKRPNTAWLVSLVSELQRRHNFTLLLTGAPYEKEINREFLEQLRPSVPVVDLAGRTSLLELAGALRACALFVSSDSGPYHMAVALRVPTLALFNYDTPQHSSQHYHHHEWVECRRALNDQHLTEALNAAERLLRIEPPRAP